MLTKYECTSCLSGAKVRHQVSTSLKCHVRDIQERQCQRRANRECQIGFVGGSNVCTRVSRTSTMLWHLLDGPHLQQSRHFYSFGARRGKAKTSQKWHNKLKTAPQTQKTEAAQMFMKKHSYHSNGHSKWTWQRERVFAEGCTLHVFSVFAQCVCATPHILVGTLRLPSRGVEAHELVGMRARINTKMKLSPSVSAAS